MSEAFQADPFLGSTFQDRYRIEACIGRGAMGAIYKATDLTLDRTVAIKVLQRKHIQNRDMLERFKREMQTTTSIEHPNTIRVYEYGVTDEQEMFLVMEYLDGLTVADVIVREGPLDVERTIDIALKVAHALAAAHEKDIVHRDLKPDNIMLLKGHGRKDHVKVFDFGLARYIEDRKDQPRLTMGDHRVGTPITMAPEYIVKGKVGRRSDLYGLGVTMFNALTGQPPFKGTPYKVLHAHVKERPPPITDFRQDVPDWLRRVVEQLLEKNPNDRQRNALVVIDQLDHRTTNYASEAEHAFDDIETLSGNLSKAELREALSDPPPPKDLSPNAAEETTAVPGAERIARPTHTISEEDTVPMLTVPPPAPASDEDTAPGGMSQRMTIAIGVAIALLLALNLVYLMSS